jgi:competence protein ComEA
MRIHLVSLVLCGVLTALAPAAIAGARIGPSVEALARAGQEQPAPKSTVNLNTATIDQLTTLPGVGRKTAELIIEYRTKSGGFKKIEELMNVKGIGEKTFLKLKPLVSAPPKTDKTGA